jgi:OPA family glycerol-3-phosphate transporter-like MFS transporter
MMDFFLPKNSLKPVSEERVGPVYERLRWQVFIGIFIGYAGYYLVRKNFSMAIPDLAKRFDPQELGFVMSGLPISYGISKFVMGYLSDKSNARIFLSSGLLLSGLTMMFMGLSNWATSSVPIMFGLLLLNGWFQGMGWPPCGRIMVYWYSQKERGLKMSLWNVAHNVGGGLVGPFANWSVIMFGVWQSKLYFPGAVAVILAIMTYLLVRDTPQSCGLPPIEEYKNDHSNPLQLEDNESMSTQEIFKAHILNNRLLWYIAFANVFIYLVRYGVLDWSPLYLERVKGYSLKESGWAYFAYEYAGIPGTLLCGWISDKIFKGRRAPATIIYMMFVLLALIVYWKNPPGHAWVDQLALVTIGFFIYGPVMLIGLFAIDLVPKNAAGTAAGLTGLFGYLAGAVFANMLMGYILYKWGWEASFILLILSCVLSMVCMIPTWKREQLLFSRME